MLWPVVPFEKTINDRGSREDTVNGNVPASTSLDYTVGASISFRTVHIHNCPGDVSRDKGGNLSFEIVDFRRLFVSVRLDLFWYESPIWYRFRRARRRGVRFGRHCGVFLIVCLSKASTPHQRSRSSPPSRFSMGGV